MQAKERKILITKLIISTCTMPTTRTSNYVESNGSSLTIEWGKVIANKSMESEKEITTLNWIIDFSVKSNIIDKKSIMESEKNIYS